MFIIKQNQKTNSKATTKKKTKKIAIVNISENKKSQIRNYVKDKNKKYDRGIYKKLFLLYKN